MSKNLFWLVSFLFVVVASTTIQLFSQTFAPTKFYLIDSLDLKVLTKNDRKLLDSCLTLFHSVKEDSIKIKHVNFIVEQCQDEKVWPKYNDWIYKFAQQKLSNHPSETYKKKLLTALAEAINNIGYYYDMQGDVPKALSFYNKSLKIKKEVGDKEGVAVALHNIGHVYLLQGNISYALECFRKSLKLHEEVGNKSGIAASLHSLGGVYSGQGDIPKALEYYHRSLKIRVEISDKHGVSACLNNIGEIYRKQADYPKALEYYQKGLIIQEEIGFIEGVAVSLNNIGWIYNAMGDTSKTLEYYHKSLKIFEETGNKRRMASPLTLIGVIYSENGNLSKALEYFQKALKIRVEIGDKEGESFNLSGLGNVELQNNNLTSAASYGIRSLTLAQEIGYPENIRGAAELLSKVYYKQATLSTISAQNKAEYSIKALEMYKLFVQMKDSMINENNQKAAVQQQAKYEYEKQKTIDDAKYEKQIAIEKEAKAKQKVITYATAGGLGLVAIFLIFVFNRLQITKRQKQVIEEQKLEVEGQKKVVEQAHFLLEVKNKEITDSIQYAKRIQAAILPSNSIINESLPNNFIYYKPKDIVAGDFYWLEKLNDSILIAAADCTGHGVPGAMISVVCCNALNRSVREHQLIEPNQILIKTREIVIQEFEKSEEEVKDGMDISLCKINFHTNQLSWSGANNPLWIIRDGELLETKADKQPIGKFEIEKPFTQHVVEIHKNDKIYLFTDGYQDQFGGEKGKKFKAAKLKELLLSIQSEEMERQKEIINTTFENWKSDVDQVDDVCIIGIRI